MQIALAVVGLGFLLMMAVDLSREEAWISFRITVGPLVAITLIGLRRDDQPTWRERRVAGIRISPLAQYIGIIVLVVGTLTPA
jgi:hypothetical protein